MARGAAGKLAKKNRKKEEKARMDEIFGSDGGDDAGAGDGSHDFGPADIPMPPGMSSGGGDDDDDSSDDDKAAGADTNNDESVLPKKKKKRSLLKKKRVGADAENEEMEEIMRKRNAKGGAAAADKGGIKGTPLILLIMLTGSTILPALIYASDFLGNYMAKNHVMGNIGYRMGFGQVPRKRVISFYEKHDPTKLEDVPKILSKHYGDYPLLIKKLERKYQDYGYFLNWEEDEAPMTLAIEQLHETYHTWITSYWNVYAPTQVKTVARNIRYNLTFLAKKFKKVWKRTVWPVLEPFFGVPKGAAKQKREDAANARARQRATGGATKSKRAQYRDDVDETGGSTTEEEYN